MTEADEPRLEAIEELPLEQRANAYTALHDELLAELEADDEAPQVG